MKRRSKKPSGVWFRRNVDGTDLSGLWNGEFAESVAVYRVMHRLRHREQSRVVISDLIFYGTEPHVVLEWAVHSDMISPLVYQKLDTAQLSQFEDVGIDYVYRGLIEFPHIET
jgi:hypothetical protein